MLLTDNEQSGFTVVSDADLTAQIEPFDSFWEAPEDIERGYERFYQFYKHNYLAHLPAFKDARILVISCGPGYFLNMLRRHGYSNAVGIDSDETKVALARAKGLNCHVDRAFRYLRTAPDQFDVIFAEQEINHLTKREILAFFRLCRDRLKDGGTLIVHSINGATPLTGSESRAGNFDHYNSFTEYSLAQTLEFSGFGPTRVIPLNLYVFYRNPVNYVALTMHKLYSFFVRVGFVLVGKSAKIFTKKIAAVSRKPGPHA